MHNTNTTDNTRPRITLDPSVVARFFPTVTARHLKNFYKPVGLAYKRDCAVVHLDAKVRLKDDAYLVRYSSFPSWDVAGGYALYDERAGALTDILHDEIDPDDLHMVDVATQLAGCAAGGMNVEFWNKLELRYHDIPPRTSSVEDSTGDTRLDPGILMRFFCYAFVRNLENFDKPVGLLSDEYHVAHIRAKVKLADEIYAARYTNFPSLFPEDGYAIYDRRASVLKKVHSYELDDGARQALELADYVAHCAAAGLAPDFWKSVERQAYGQFGLWNYYK